MTERLLKLRTLLGPTAILLPIRRGEKGPKWAGWSKVTLEQTLDPDFAVRMGRKETPYQELLEKGNVGVLLGRAGGGLCTIDFDGEEHARAFLEINPDLSGALRTRGKRGCNLWLRMEGEFPALSRIADAEGRHVGEWRSDGGQTVIAGDHPDGGQYRIEVEAPPAPARWQEIRWPNGWILSAAGRQKSAEGTPTRASDPTIRQRFAAEVLGDVDWTSDTQGWVQCPGAHLHKAPTKGDHTCVYLDGVPTLWCFHNSCAEEVKRKNAELRAKIFDAEAVKIPNGTATWGQAAERFYKILDQTGEFYRFGGQVAGLHREGETLKLEILDAPAAVSRFDTTARFAVWRTTKEGSGWAAAPCNREWATILLAAAEKNALKSVRTLLKCPTVFRDGEELKVASGGFCGAARVLVTRSAELPEVDLEEAVEGILDLVADVDFVDGGDKARAVASIITPAMVFGGLLGGRSPADAAEADRSQAGKTYRQRVVAAVYGDEVSQVHQHSGRGVGSLEEALGDAISTGASFIQLDNFRGKLSSPVVESFLTAERSVRIRLPHRGYIEASPDNVVLYISSNGLDMTPDMANRCSIIRQVKREGVTFRSYENGVDLLGHVRRNHGYYLACVFEVIREWWRRGRPADAAVAKQHPFHWWAGKLGWITAEIFGLPGMLATHRDIQNRTRLSVPGWLRQLAVVIDEMGELGKPMRAGDLLGLSQNADVAVPGLKGNVGETQTLQHIGRMLGRAFPEGQDEVALERYTLRREVLRDTSRRGGASGGKDIRTYTFAKPGV